MSKDNIRPITMEHIQRYGDIYAKAFSGEPWNDPWKPEDAVIHVRELLESKQAYGLEYVLDGKVVGFILGTSMLFHYGRTFEINDLVVDPEYQRRGIAQELLPYMNIYPDEELLPANEILNSTLENSLSTEAEADTVADTNVPEVMGSEDEANTRGGNTYLDDGITNEEAGFAD